ncbi:MAG: cytochrome d ubiquinol oxidase subunit II [Candidatus Binataceae bacterium]|jgi:cytochrome d ubiquinol oxidase subunit II
MPFLAYMAFAIIALAVLLYVLMDGWDLGVGILFLLAAREQQRDEMMESIAPFWDGNETWLVFGGVTLFAAFPAVYASTLQALYLPVMVMLFALVFRGISFEFRSHSKASKILWNWAFASGSIIAAFAQGMMLGKLVQGVPLQHGPYGQTFTISLFPLLCGIAMVAGYALLGSAWLVHKTDGTTQIFGREVSRAAWLLTMALFSIACVWTPLSVPEVAKRWFTLPGSLLFVAIAIALVAVSVVFWRSIWSLQSYARLLQLAVAMTVLAFIGFAATIWPYAIPYRISIVEGAGDLASIKFALVGIVVVLPVVLTYQLYAYRVFGGKALDIEVSYGTPMRSDIRTRRTHERESHLHLS